MSEFDLRSLLEALHSQGVEFVVIGGVAVGAHGFIRAPRTWTSSPTRIPRTSGAWPMRWTGSSRTLPTVGGRPFNPEGDFGVIRRGGNVAASTMFGGLDVVQRAQGVPGYSQLAEDAVESELLGVPVRVCSLTRLRAMKQAQSRAQDQLDLENLPEE